MGDDSQDKLFSYAVRAMAARAYSEATLRRKLMQRANAEDVERVLGRVKAAGFLDDATYAEGYARMYMNKWGQNKIRRSLMEKGVSRAVVDAALAKVEPETQPTEVIGFLLARYKSRHREDKAKAVRFLISRGYSVAEALEGWARYEKENSE